MRETIRILAYEKVDYIDPREQCRLRGGGGASLSRPLTHRTKSTEDHREIKNNSIWF